MTCGAGNAHRLRMLGAFQGRSLSGLVSAGWLALVRHHRRWHNGMIPELFRPTDNTGAALRDRVGMARITLTDS